MPSREQKQNFNRNITKGKSLNQLFELLNHCRVSEASKVKIQKYIPIKQAEIEKTIPVWMHGFNVKHKKLARVAMYHSMRKGENFFIIDKLTKDKRTLAYNTDSYTMGECCGVLLVTMTEILNKILDDAKDWGGNKTGLNGKGLDEYIDSLYEQIENAEQE